MRWKALCRGAGWLLQAGEKGVDGCLEFAYEQRDREKAREGMCIHPTDKETCSSQCKSWRWQLRWEFLLPLPPSFMILLHDQYFKLPLHQECLKTSSCSKENHSYSRHTQGCSDLRQPGAEAGDGDAFLHPRGAGILWHFPQLFLAKMISFHKCKITHTAVLMTSVSIRTKPPVAVFFCQGNKSSIAAHFSDTVYATTRPFLYTWSKASLAALLLKVSVRSWPSNSIISCWQGEWLSPRTGLWL